MNSKSLSIYFWSMSPSCCNVGKCLQSPYIVVDVLKWLFCWLRSLVKTILLVTKSLYWSRLPSFYNAGQLLQVALNIQLVKVSKLLYHFWVSGQCLQVAPACCSMSTSGCNVGQGQYSQYNVCCTVVYSHPVALLLVKLPSCCTCSPSHCSQIQLLLIEFTIFKFSKSMYLRFKVSNTLYYGCYWTAVSKCLYPIPVEK